MLEKDSTRPTMKAATIEPMMLPNPPRITTSKAGERGCQREGKREKQTRLDAKRRCHRSIIGKRAQSTAEIGPIKQERDGDDRENTNSQHDEICPRNEEAFAVQRARYREAERRRFRPEAHDNAGGQHEIEAERQHHGRELIVDKAFNEKELEKIAERRSGNDGREHGDRIWQTEGGSHPIGDIAAHHVESAVREIDHAEDAEDEREAKSKQSVLRAKANPDNCRRDHAVHAAAPNETLLFGSW